LMISGHSTGMPFIPPLHN